MRQVLLVEDNPADRALTQRFLQSNEIQPFSVVCVSKLEEGLQKITSSPFDVVILDLSLPDSSGLDSLRSILNVAKNLPIVVMTGFSDEKLGIEAVRIGAQDYLMKSQTSSELLIRSLLFAIERQEMQSRPANKANSANQTILKVADLEIDLEKQRVSFTNGDGRSALALTPLEFKIFVFLFRNQGQTVSRGQIVAEVWGTEIAEISSRTVDKHISALKKKSPKIDGLINAIYGVGYKFEILKNHS